MRRNRGLTHKHKWKEGRRVYHGKTVTYRFCTICGLGLRETRSDFVSQTENSNVTTP